MKENVVIVRQAGHCFGIVAAGTTVLAGSIAELIQHSPSPRPPFGEGTILDYSGNWTLSASLAFIMRNLIKRSELAEKFDDRILTLFTLGIIGLINFGWEYFSHNPNPEMGLDFLGGFIAGALGTYLGSFRAQPNSKLYT